MPVFWEKMGCLGHQKVLTCWSWQISFFSCLTGITLKDKEPDAYTSVDDAWFKVSEELLIHWASTLINIHVWVHALLIQFLQENYLGYLQCWSNLVDTKAKEEGLTAAEWKRMFLSSQTYDGIKITNELHWSSRKLPQCIHQAFEYNPSLSSSPLICGSHQIYAQQWLWLCAPKEGMRNIKNPHSTPFSRLELANNHI